MVSTAARNCVELHGVILGAGTPEMRDFATRDHADARSRQGGLRDLRTHQPVEDVGFRDEHLVEAERPQDRRRDDGPADDHVDPAGLEPRVVATDVGRLERERAEDVLGRGAGQAEVVDALAGRTRGAPARSRRRS